MKATAKPATSRRLKHAVRCVLGLALAATAIPGAVRAQASRSYPLDSADGLKLLDVTAEAATHEGRKGVRVAPSAGVPGEAETLAVIEGLEFSSGVIEAEIAGAPGGGASQGARGFVGIAFRVQPGGKTYDAFYLRPTNGRAEDQERRNHASQYISHPDWPWHRLRKETPGRYEAYVDLVPGAWTKVKIEVRGERARLYVHGQEQPTIVVNDLKTGASAKGAVALWVGPGTVAHFRNVTVSP
jgi:hypothetical protein